MAAADMGPGRPGRTWRPLQDTADAVPGESLGRSGWVNWRRSGRLLSRRRSDLAGSRDHHSRPDPWPEVFRGFRRAFYGGPNQGPELKPYTFDDLVQALQAVTPYDWADYFHDRLTSTS